MSAGRQPAGRRGGDPPQQVEPVAAAVQRHPRFVRPGLGRQEFDLAGGHVRHVGGQDRDPAAQFARQRPVKVALVDVRGEAPGRPVRGGVAPGAADRGRLDVGGVQFRAGHGRGHRDADRARAAAQVDDDSTRPGHRDGLPDEELGTAARHEDPGVHGDPQPGEFRPAQDMLKGLAGDPLVHHRVQLAGGPGRGDEQLGLVLGEDAARGPEPGDDQGISWPGYRRILPAGTAVRTA